MSAPRKHSDAAILAALLAAPSVASASLALPLARGALAKRCMTGDLLIAFEDCALRGLEKRSMTNRRIGIESMTEEQLGAREQEMAAQ